MRSAGDAYPVSAIAGMLPRRAPSSRILRMSDWPFMPGIAMSLTSTSDASFSSASSASAPHPTATTFAPHSASTAAIASRASTSSSTSKMRRPSSAGSGWSASRSKSIEAGSATETLAILPPCPLPRRHPPHASAGVRRLRPPLRAVDRGRAGRRAD